MKRIYQYALCGIVMTSVLASCSDDEYSPLPSAVVPSSIQMNMPETSSRLIYKDATGANCLPMIKGETLQLNYTLAPDSATFKNVNWTSSNPAIASVTDDGLITALSGSGVGYSLIEVAPLGVFSGSGINDVIKVVVSNEMIPAEQIAIISSSDELYGGDTLHLSTQILPSTSTYKTVEWTSSNPQAATISADGVLTAQTTSATLVPVTIRATALDGSGIVAEKVINIRQVVQPLDVVLDQRFSADQGYYCALNEQSLTLSYTTTPAECTTSLIEWTTSDASIATVDAGKVTFHGFGEVSITAKAPETGKESTVKLNIPMGLIRETYHNADHYSFYNAAQSGNGTSSSHKWYDGHLTITTYMQNATTCRADIKGYDTPFWLHAGNYSFFAIRMDDVKDKGASSRNINLDVVGTSESGKEYKALGNGNNKYTYDYKCSDGSHVFIYDLSKVACGTGGLLPTNEGVSFRTFQIKYADMKGLTSQIDYNLYWIQTFKSLEEIQAYIAAEGLTYE